MSKIRYAVVQWREVDVPQGTPAPTGGRARQAEALVPMLEDMGVIHRGPFTMQTTDDQLELAQDNEYGYDDYVAWED